MTNASSASQALSVANALARIQAKTVKVGIIGLGYVGLPLASLFCRKGFATLGFDVDPGKVEALTAGRSYIKHIPASDIADLNASGRFAATTDFARLAECDAILICVPTPLTKQREPDMTYVVATAEAIAKTLRPGQLVILESSTYPGTTDDVVRPILERGGLKSGSDFYLAYSPEREDPGNPDFATAGIPKVVGGDGADALTLSVALYDAVVVRTVPVSSAATAEAVKLTENIFRAVNIALVNELKVVYTAMGIDVWEVIEAAKSKPFGFMPFYPGPGLGGHCIPIDPFYLTWKAREFDVATRFIELAGEINTAMPRYVIDQLADALNSRFSKALKGSRVLILGVAYKKNVDDIRESPALRIMDLLRAKGVEIAYHDPFVAEIHRTREHADLAGLKSQPLTAETLAAYDAVLISTDHDDIDYKLVAEAAPLVIDTRNAAEKAGLRGGSVVKA